MTRIFLLLLIALMCAPVAFSQSRDYSYYEFYVGYAYQRASNNADTFDKNGRAKINNATIDLVSHRPAYNGFVAEFNQNVTRHIGIVTSLGQCPALRFTGRPALQLAHRRCDPVCRRTVRHRAYPRRFCRSHQERHCICDGFRRRPGCTRRRTHRRARDSD